MARSARAPWALGRTERGLWKRVPHRRPPDSVSTNCVPSLPRVLPAGVCSPASMPGGIGQRHGPPFLEEKELAAAISNTAAGATEDMPALEPGLRGRPMHSWTCLSVISSAVSARLSRRLLRRRTTATGFHGLPSALPSECLLRASRHPPSLARRDIASICSQFRRRFQTDH